jgi:WD40 repeat protein
LAGSGLTLSAGAFVALLAASTTSAKVPAALVQTTLSALPLAVGKGTAGTGISAAVASLLEGGQRAMNGAKLYLLLAFLLTLGTGAAVTFAYPLLASNCQGKREKRPAQPLSNDKNQAAPTKVSLVRTDVNGDPLPPGALVRLGETRFRPGARITHIAFSPDGKRLASWGSFLYHHDRLSIWDTATGKELRTELVEENRLSEFAWCADGRGFAILTSNQQATENDFLIWEFTDARAKNPAPARPGPRVGKVVVVGQGDSESYGPFAVAANGKWLAAYHAGGKIQPEVTLFRLAPAQAARHSKIVRTIKDLPTDVRTLALSGNSRFLLAFSHKDPNATTQTLTVYETAKGQKQKTLSVPMALQQGTRKSLTVSPDGSLLALGLEDGTARLIDLKTGRQLRSVGNHLVKGRGKPWGGVSTLAFSPDGKRLITGGRDNAVKVWGVGSGREIFNLRGHHSWPEAAAFTADGKRIASAGQDSLIRLWDTATGRELVPPKGHYHTVWGLAVSRDGRLALTSAWEDTARLWNLRTGREVRRFAHGSVSRAVLLDERTVLTRWQGKWKLWDSTTGKEKPLPGALAKGRGEAFGLSLDGSTLLTADNQTVTLWAWPSGKKLQQIHAEKRVQKALVTSDGRSVLTMDEQGLVAVWDRKTGKNQGTLPLGVRMMYQDLLQLTSEGLLVAAGVARNQPAGDKNSVLVCDVQTRKIIREFQIQPTTRGVFYLISLAVSNDGRTVALGQSDGNAVLYEVASGLTRRVLPGHREAISSLAFTRTGGLITTSLDHSCLVWDVTLRSGEAAAKPLAGKDLNQRWADLGQRQPKPAFQALAQLAADPKAAVALVRCRLQPARGIDAATLDRIVSDLDDKRFKMRRKASLELERYGETIVAGVRKRLAKAESLELRVRLQAFLNKYDRAEPTPDRLREIRALQLLEELATPEALAVLRNLAGGNVNARLTQEAGESLKRCRNVNLRVSDSR